jgi:hypothetical protein
MHQIRSGFLHFLHALLILQLDAEQILPPTFEMAEKGSLISPDGARSSTKIFRPLYASIAKFSAGLPRYSHRPK